MSERETSRTTWLVVAAAAAWGMGCATDRDASLVSTSDGDRGAVAAQGQVRAAYVASRQAEGTTDARYALRVAPDRAVFLGRNPATGMRAELGAAGATLSKAGEPWHVTVGGAGTGCADTRVELSPVASPRAGSSPNRVEYARSAAGIELSEWYANGPLGLEQGFTLNENPCAQGSDVAIAVHVEGLEAVGDEGSVSVSLRDPTGVTRVRYTDLSARDATGRTLEVGMTVESDAIVLRVAASGARFPIVVDPLIWVQLPELTASDGLDGDNFGISVSISGSTALVGSIGSAYVFVQTQGAWTLQTELAASDGAGESASDRFGAAVAISGETAVVGAYEKTVSGNAAQGVADVFVRSGSTWTQQAELVANDGAAGDYFGWSVAVSGNTVVVGAENKTIGSNVGQGAAYVFTQSGNAWTQQPPLVASDGAAGDGIGYSVALSGSTAIVGAPSANAGRGAAYVFAPSANGWPQQAELTASDGALFDNFGTSVGVSGNTAIIGASDKNVGSNAAQGVAYVFVQSGNSWTQQPPLVASDGAAEAIFGSSVALSGSTAVIGADHGGGPPGAAYVFVQSGNTWTEQQEFVASNGAKQDLFGCSVAISGTTAVVGAYQETVGLNTTQGAAYIESYGLTNASACSSASACASGNCVDRVCCDTPCDTLCQACTAALKQSGTDDGTCGPAAAGLNPHMDPCVATPVSSCGLNGQCDGTGACQYYAAGTACGSVCMDDTSTAEACDGNGSCSLLPPGTDCAPDLCVNGICARTCTTSSDCDPSAYCDGGTCAARILESQPCSVANSCAGTGAACVDGVCCESACAGECQACDVAGSVGLCAPVPSGTPHGTRPPCEGAGTACGGACDGRTNPTACTYPSPDTLCGTTCSGDEQTPRVCSMGACIANSSLTTRCGAYTCDGETKCRSTCASASDCASGYTCVGDICKPAGNSCATDGHTAVDGEGNRTDCAPYLCSGGRCASTCSATADCLAPTVCDPMGQCVALPSSSGGGTSAAACACVDGASGLAGGANWGAALAVAALAGARRRGRPRCGR